MGFEQHARVVVDWVVALPLGTRILTALVAGFSGLLALLRAFSLLSTGAPSPHATLGYPYLVLVPGQAVWYPWTLLTAAFCETSVVEFVVSLAMLPFAAQFLEQHWGAGELLRFSGIVVAVSNGLAAALSLLLFVVLRSDRPIFGTQFHGLEALQTAFLVAFAQLIPQHQIELLGARFALRVRDVPMLYVGFSNVMCVLGYMSPFVLIQFGWLVSWVYLRFYQLGELGVRGDRSDAFAFVQWFPPFVHKPLGRVCDAVHAVVERVGAVPRWAAGYTDLELNVDNAATPASANGRAEAERRRAMALEALDQRMADAKVPLAEEAQRSGEASSSSTT